MSEVREGTGLRVAADYSFEILAGPWHRYCGNTFTNPQGKVIEGGSIYNTKEEAVARILDQLGGAETYLSDSLERVRKGLEDLRAKQGT